MTNETTSTTTRLGSTGPEVFPIALGCMGMSGMYGPSDRNEAVATVIEAIDRGVTLLDTGDFYGMGHNELLLREALAARPGKALVSVKFGALRGPDGRWNGVDARPAAVENFVAYSLQRLGVDAIDVYRPARLDPQVPIEDTIGAIATLIERGYVRHVGLSEVGADTIRRAHATHPIADLQIEYSLASRRPEQSIFPTLEELGISATLYGVLSRGLLAGSVVGGGGDFRAVLPRFAGDAGTRNAAAVAALRGLADESGRSVVQLCIGWVLAVRPGFVPLVGSRTRAQLADALGALDKPLSPDEVAAVERALAPDAIVGSRYPDAAMAHLDSER